jgi:3-deoxy-D-manno-octulosonic acid kinase
VAKSSGIRSVSEQAENRYIIYDAQLSGQISAQWFDPEYWRAHAEVEAVGAGRGQAWFIQNQAASYVLRHYRRGGLMAKITPDRYLWTSINKTRAWREYQLLAKLQELGLPAPRPVAAQVLRQGSFYSADLLTRRIPDSQPLSRILTERPLEETLWHRIGKCIRAFHDHDIYHADLNAHNILLDAEGRVYLIDFDKSGVDQDSSWQQRTLQRLYRSLTKLQTQDSNFHFTEANWQTLLAGYGA